jgi:DNA-binding response OmpR family regulator
MARKIKIAIIEDDFQIVQMYRSKFEKEGYGVQTAADGLSGLKLIQEYRPNVVLLDIMMPEMSGVDMLKKLRRDPNMKNVRIIVLTNMDDPTTERTVRDLGANDYFVKADLSPKEVEKRVAATLESK